MSEPVDCATTDTAIGLFRCLDATQGPVTREDSLLQARRVIRAVAARGHDRDSLVAQIASEVGADIVEGIVPPGHDLNTVELARRYQTSRTPVREALMLLEREGLVDIPPRRRPRVHVHTIKEAREIYVTRTAIFELIAVEVASLASAEDTALLKVILERMKRAADMGDVAAFSWLSVEFHETDTRISRNSTAKRIHDSLLLRTLAMRRLSLSRGNRMQQSLDDHIQLVKAYETHDSNLAGAIMRANHMAAFQAVENYHATAGQLMAPHTFGPSASN
ncbi:MAG: GntR family transcriptional regulator [Jannaschia sp.]